MPARHSATTPNTSTGIGGCCRSHISASVKDETSHGDGTRLLTTIDETAVSTMFTSSSMKLGVVSDMIHYFRQR